MRRVSATVLLLGLVSLLTDVSSEMVASVLPLYLTAMVGLAPIAYGVLDGLYQGVSAVVRIAGVTSATVVSIPSGSPWPGTARPR